MTTLRVIGGGSGEPPDNTAMAAELRHAAEHLVDDSPRRVTGVAIAITYEDGSIGTLFESSHHALLLGAVTVLRRRVEAMLEGL